MSQPWVNADPAHPCPAGSEAVRAADARHTIEEGPSLFKLRHDDEPSLLSAPLFPQVSGALCLVSRAGKDGCLNLAGNASGSVARDTRPCECLTRSG